MKTAINAIMLEMRSYQRSKKHPAATMPWRLRRALPCTSPTWARPAWRPHSTLAWAAPHGRAPWPHTPPAADRRHQTSRPEQPCSAGSNARRRARLTTMGGTASPLQAQATQQCGCTCRGSTCKSCCGLRVQQTRCGDAAWAAHLRQQLRRRPRNVHQKVLDCRQQGRGQWADG